MSALMAAQLIVTAVLVGLILTIQRVHYPSLAFADRNRFVHGHAFHVSRITPVVAPLMLAELVLCAAGGYFDAALAQSRLYWAASALVLVVWISTATIQVPLHRKLAEGYDDAVLSRLVRSNWVRTVAWCTRLLLLCALVVTP